MNEADFRDYLKNHLHYKFSEEVIDDIYGKYLKNAKYPIRFGIFRDLDDPKCEELKVFFVVTMPKYFGNACKFKVTVSNYMEFMCITRINESIVESHLSSNFFNLTKALQKAARISISKLKLNPVMLIANTELCYEGKDKVGFLRPFKIHKRLMPRNTR